jgi:hypothetical protein
VIFLLKNFKHYENSLILAKQSLGKLISSPTFLSNTESNENNQTCSRCNFLRKKVRGIFKTFQSTGRYTQKALVIELPSNI